MRNKTIVTVLSSSFLLLSIVLSRLEVSRALAQNGCQFKDWNHASDEVRFKPKIACSDLRSLTGYEFSVITTNLTMATDGAPEHCHVSGRILPEIRLDVGLPTFWNRRFYMFGNGGFAGQSFETE